MSFHFKLTWTSPSASRADLCDYLCTRIFPLSLHFPPKDHVNAADILEYPIIVKIAVKDSGLWRFFFSSAPFQQMTTATPLLAVFPHLSTSC